MSYKKLITLLFCIFSFAAFGGVGGGLIKLGLGDIVHRLQSARVLDDSSFILPSLKGKSHTKLVPRSSVLDGSSRGMRGKARPDLVPGLGGAVADSIPEKEMQKLVGNWIYDDKLSQVYSIVVIRQEGNEFVIETVPNHSSLHVPEQFIVNPDGGRRAFWQHDVVISTEHSVPESQTAYLTDSLVVEDSAWKQRHYFTLEGDRLVKGSKFGIMSAGFSRFRRMTDEEVAHFLGDNYQFPQRGVRPPVN